MKKNKLKSIPFNTQKLCSSWIFSIIKLSQSSSPHKQPRLNSKKPNLFGRIYQRPNSGRSNYGRPYSGRPSSGRPNSGRPNLLGRISQRLNSGRANSEWSNFGRSNSGGRILEGRILQGRKTHRSNQGQINKKVELPQSIIFRPLGNSAFSNSAFRIVSYKNIRDKLWLNQYLSVWERYFVLKRGRE